MSNLLLRTEINSDLETLGSPEHVPPILAGHENRSVGKRVECFYDSLEQIFEAWVNRTENPSTQRSYRKGVELFLEFMGWRWPEDSFCLLQATVPDVQEWRRWLEEARGNAPKTLNARLSALCKFYKYLREAAIEMRLPINVPNPAHSQFIHRGRADPLVETPALTLAQARMLRSLPQGEDLVAYRDRAILDFYLYSWARIGTGCRLMVSDFLYCEEDPKIRIQEKGNKRRTIGLHINAAVSLRDYIERAELARGPLFRGRLNSNSKKLGTTGLKTRGMYKLLQSYLSRLPGALVDREENDPLFGASPKRCLYHPHVIRATAATLTLEAGEDIRKVQEQLGHAQVGTTQIYDKRRRGTRESASHSNPV